MLTKGKAGQSRQDKSPESEISAKFTPESINGPKGLPVVGNLPEFMRNPFEFLSHCSQKYGEVAKLYLPLLGTTYFVSQPAYVEQMLVAKPSVLVRPNLYQIARPFLGDGLALLDGEAWLKRRRLMQPAFHKEHLSNYSTIMVARTNQLLEQWRSSFDQPRAVDEDMTQLTVEIVINSLLSTDLTGMTTELGNAFREIMEWINKRAYSPFQWPQFVPTPLNRRFRKANKDLEKFVYKIIAEHRLNNTLDDLLARCIAARNFEDNSQLTDKQLRNEVMTLMLAGQDTTTNTLTWTLYLLAQHPEIEAKLHAELDTVLQGRVPTAADLPKLSYTTLIFKEVLRLYPVLWFMGRQTTQDFKLGDYLIPAGTTIMTSPWVIQRDKKFFSDPDEFKPERWQDPQIKTLPKFAYFPFGGGPRLCLGSDFAFQEMLVIVTMIAQQFKPRFAEQPNTLKPIAGLTLKPPDGIKMRLIPRA